MDEIVELEVVARRGSPLLLSGAGSEEGRRAEQLGREVAALVPKVRLTVTDAADDDDLPTLKLSARDTGVVRFLGLPRVNLFRALLEAIRRLSTHDHSFDPGWARE